MATLQELIAQQEDLSKQIQEIRLAERQDAIHKASALINEYQLTKHDLFADVGAGAVKTRKISSKVAAKYRDPVSGKEWTGRGVTPKWITANGKNKDDFLIRK